MVLAVRLPTREEWLGKLPRWWPSSDRCIPRKILLDYLLEKQEYDLWASVLELEPICRNGYCIRCTKDKCCLYPWPKVFSLI